MAAVHLAHGMPQQQGGNANIQAQIVLLRGMTNESVQVLCKKFQLMKASRVSSELDPEAKAILQQIPVRTELLKKQQAYRQMQVNQQQQLPLLLLQDGSTERISANGAATSTTHATDGQTTQAAGYYISSDRRLDRAAFSKDQFAMLRTQIAAFGHLQKNLPVLPNIQRRISPSKQEQKPQQKPPTPDETVATAEKVLEDAAKGITVADMIADGRPQHRSETSTDPYSFLLKNISYVDHTLRDYKCFDPSIMPLGVEPDCVREERENIVYDRVVARKAELAKTSVKIGGWDTNKSEVPRDNANIKLRALTEYKMLTVLPKQREMRQKVSKEMMVSDNLSMTAYPAMYLRVKKQSLREARVIEKLEKQQRDVAENKEKKKHNDFVSSIVRHADDMRTAAKAHRERNQKIGSLMLETHANVEKEEQKRIERTAKQRLQAFKANDEEKYLKLLGQAKDIRISHLLKLTDGFLDQLATSVREQQQAITKRFGGEQAEAEEEEVEEEVDSEDETKTKVDY
ncbi:transcriptional regulator [Elasticomyces elasticus]|nr:transcriptional regulator [Elasticomyces elasticus]